MFTGSEVDIGDSAEWVGLLPPAWSVCKKLLWHAAFICDQTDRQIIIIGKFLWPMVYYRITPLCSSFIDVGMLIQNTV